MGAQRAQNLGVYLTFQRESSKKQVLAPFLISRLLDCWSTAVPPSNPDRKPNYMRQLTGSVIITASRTPLEDLEFLFIDNRDVEKLTDDVHECQKLAYLSLSRNNVHGSLAPLATMANLWLVDLSYNSISSLAGLELIPALGMLDLSYNCIKSSEELSYLRDVHIVNLSLKVNTEHRHLHEHR